MTDAAPESHAEYIRDQAFTRLQSLEIGGQPFKLARRAPIRTLQVQQVPAFACFILSEQEEQRGDVTLPQFTDTLTLGFSYTIAAPNGDLGAEETGLDSFVRGVKSTLLSDPTFLQLFEFVTRVSRENELFREGEAYFAEVRVRMTVTYYTEYPPAMPNDLNLFSVRGNQPAGTPQPGADIILPPSS